MRIRASVASGIWNVTRLSPVKCFSTILPSSQSKLVLARSFMRGLRVVRPWLPMTTGTCTFPNSEARMSTAAATCSDQNSTDPIIESSFVSANSSWMSPEKMSPPNMRTTPS